MLGRNHRRKDEKSQDDVAVRQHDFKIFSFRIIQYVLNPKCFFIVYLPSAQFQTYQERLEDPGGSDGASVEDRRDRVI